VQESRTRSGLITEFMLDTCSSLLKDCGRVHPVAKGLKRICQCKNAEYNIRHLFGPFSLSVRFISFRSNSSCLDCHHCGEDAQENYEDRCDYCGSKCQLVTPSELSQRVRSTGRPGKDWLVSQVPGQICG
jgi:hypothetical protein